MATELTARPNDGVVTRGSSPLRRIHGPQLQIDTQKKKSGGVRYPWNTEQRGNEVRASRAPGSQEVAGVRVNEKRLYNK